MRVAIIGAGASGLPAIKTCLEYGFEPICFEKSNDIGGLWRFKPGFCDDEGSVMKSTVINSSKEMTAYSDFPPPASFSNYMHNTQMLNYFRMYAAHFKLLQHIRFGHEVRSVRRAPNFEKTGQWVITFDNGSVTSEETFDAVMLASGHHSTPYSPKPWPGQDNFKGRVIHSHSYKDHRGYEDKHVVVVGIGNSGGDIAVELSRIARQVQLVTRSGAWIINRIFDHGQPIDLVIANRFAYFLQETLPQRLVDYAVEKKLNSRFDHARYGLKPAFSVSQAHPTINDDLANRLASGTVVIRPNISRFTHDGVMFADGEKVNDVDVVILATGYSFSFSYLEEGELIRVEDNEVTLYQNMYPPQLAKYNTLAVLGLIQPIGSIMPISEMQARVFCDVLAGRSRLPDEFNMRAHIVKSRIKSAKRYVARRRHTIQVDYVLYMDELADLIGAKPKIARYLLSSPSFAVKLLFGPDVAYQYRLNGPHPWNEAKRAIMNVEKRVFEPTRTRRTPETLAGKPPFKPYFLNLIV
uniref:Flavin-containing monooxygenase n=1 Tax=Plectus sambesii TaxID=2011161 RepID=A0A914XVE9_9BILA